MCRLLNDDEMGGGKTGGHAMVVALHLYKLLKSSHTFTNLMIENFETTIIGVDCLIPFRYQLKVNLYYTYSILVFTTLLLQLFGASTMLNVDHTRFMCVEQSVVTVFCG